MTIAVSGMSLAAPSSSGNTAQWLLSIYCIVFGIVAVLAQFGEAPLPPTPPPIRGTVWLGGVSSFAAGGDGRSISIGNSVFWRPGGGGALSTSCKPLSAVVCPYMAIIRVCVCVIVCCSLGSLTFGIGGLIGFILGGVLMLTGGHCLEIASIYPHLPPFAPIRLHLPPVASNLPLLTPISFLVYGAFMVEEAPAAETGQGAAPRSTSTHPSAPCPSPSPPHSPHSPPTPLAQPI